VTRIFLGIILMLLLCITLQQSHVDWRQYKEEKKKKKEAQKKEWLLKDD
jgi:hypothetical protein